MLPTRTQVHEGLTQQEAADGQEAQRKHLSAVQRIGMGGAFVAGAVVAWVTHIPVAGWLNTNAAGIAALATLGLAYLGWQQLRTFRSQERWMRESALQTREALGIARQSADAAARAADAAIVAQRPWLKIDQASLIPDFTIDKDGMRGSINLVVRNVGNSPAVRVLITAVLTAPVMGGTVNPNEIALKEAESSNELWRSAQIPLPAPTLFPGDTQAGTHGFQLRPDEIADALRRAERPDHIWVFLGCSVAPRTLKMTLQLRGTWLEYAT